MTTDGGGWTKVFGYVDDNKRAITTSVPSGINDGLSNALTGDGHISRNILLVLSWQRYVTYCD